MGVQSVVDILSSADLARVVGHADADGVSSAVCVCSALSEVGVPYHFTAVDEPSDAPDAVATDDDTVTVLCDLGAAYLDRLPETGAVVVDHHPPHGRDSFDGVLIGTGEPSSSLVAYRVAREAGAADALTGFAALVGAVGDGAPLDEEPASQVVDATVEAGAERTETARLPGSNPTEALAYSTRPYTRLSGEYEEARDFVEERGIEGFDSDMSTAAVLLALTNEDARPEAVGGIVGETVVVDGARLHSVSRYVEACAKTGAHGLAFSVCAHPGRDNEARSTWRAFESDVIERVRGARVDDETEPAVARITEGDTSPVADVLYDWVTGDVVVVNTSGDASIRSGSFDCGRVAREAAEETDGEGGGHETRAGATFDAPAEVFVRAVRGAL